MLASSSSKNISTASEKESSIDGDNVKDRNTLFDKIGKLFITKMTDLNKDMTTNAKELKSEIGTNIAKELKSNIANNAKEMNDKITEMKSDIATGAKEIKSDVTKKKSKRIMILF